MKYHVRIVYILALVFSACKSDPNAVFEHRAANTFKYAHLSGMIYDDRNRPCQNVKVIITEFDPQVKPLFKNNHSNYIDSHVWSDINGRFSFPLITKGRYTLRVEKEGLESQEMKINFTNRTQTLYFKMSSYQGLLLKAEEALAEGNTEESKDYWRRASLLKPEDNGWLYLGLIIYYRQGSFELAKQLLLELENRNVNFETLKDFREMLLD